MQNGTENDDDEDESRDHVDLNGIDLDLLRQLGIDRNEPQFDDGAYDSQMPFYGGIRSKNGGPMTE